MFKRWLDKKFSKAQSDEAQHFLQMLKGANTDVIAETSARAILAAAVFEERTGNSLFQVAFWADEKTSTVVQLAAEIKKFQREGKPQHAVGFMVWLHTVRAATFPELKAVARQIWDELDRAPSDHEAFERVDAISKKTGLSVLSNPGQRPVDFERL